jgi:hypothetical protein
MIRQKSAMIALAVLGFGLPAQADDPFYSSEVLQEVVLPDGSVLRTSQTTEVITPDVADEPVMVDAELPWGEVCIFTFFDGLSYYDDHYDAPFGDSWGNGCETYRQGYLVTGMIVSYADL